MVIKNCTPTLPGIGIFFKFMSTLALLPFGWNQKESIMRPRRRAVFYYWIFFGVIVPGLHAISSMTLFGKLVFFISKSNGLDSVNHLLKFTLTLLMVLANTSFACYATIVMRNYQETVIFYNNIIRLRTQLRGYRSLKICTTHLFVPTAQFLRARSAEFCFYVCRGGGTVKG